MFLELVDSDANFKKLTEQMGMAMMAPLAGGDLMGAMLGGMMGRRAQMADGALLG